MAFGIDENGQFINIFGVKNGKDAPLFTFKGIKETVSQLPVSGEVGDVWLVEEDNHKYAWNGTSWSDIGIQLENFVIDIGSYQESYHGYVIPKVPTIKAQEIYNKYKEAVPIVIKWTFLGSETYLNVISADYVAGVYSLDVALHNQYHIAYSWEDTTTTYCNFEVNEGVMEDVVTTGESGTLADDEIALINNDANIINDGEKYYLSNKFATLTYRTYINTDVGTNTDLVAKAIYVQLNESAVNYGTWSKEDLTISDLTNYVKNTDYASTTGGVIKVSNTYATTTTSIGILTSVTKSYDTYDGLHNNAFISKGTLENAITGKAIKSTWTGTQDEFDALTTYDDNTDYRII